MPLPKSTWLINPGSLLQKMGNGKLLGIWLYRIEFLRFLVISRVENIHLQAEVSPVNFEPRKIHVSKKRWMKNWLLSWGNLDLTWKIMQSSLFQILRALSGNLQPRNPLEFLKFNFGHSGFVFLHLRTPGSKFWRHSKVFFGGKCVQNPPENREIF